MPLEFGKYMSNRPSWVASQFALRAQIEQARIQDKEVDVQLYRGSADLPVQTVRVEFDSTYNQIDGASGSGSARKVTLFGVRGHPEIDDFDVKVWDTFTMDDMEFTVVSVNRQIIGQIQAHAEAVG